MFFNHKDFSKYIFVSIKCKVLGAVILHSWVFFYMIVLWKLSSSLLNVNVFWDSGPWIIHWPHNSLWDTASAFWVWLSSDANSFQNLTIGPFSHAEFQSADRWALGFDSQWTLIVLDILQKFDQLNQAVMITSLFKKWNTFLKRSVHLFSVTVTKPPTKNLASILVLFFFFFPALELKFQKNRFSMCNFRYDF